MRILAIKHKFLSFFVEHLDGYIMSKIDLVSILVRLLCEVDDHESD